MKINKLEIQHLKAIMLERGMSHCEFCRDLFKRLESTHKIDCMNSEEKA